jgi:hypothetical protein
MGPGGSIGEAGFASSARLPAPVGQGFAHVVNGRTVLPIEMAKTEREAKSSNRPTHMNVALLVGCVMATVPHSVQGSAVMTVRSQTSKAAGGVAPVRVRSAGHPASSSW